MITSPFKALKILGEALQVEDILGYLRGKTLLDIGTGEGLFPNFLYLISNKDKNRMPKITGIDVEATPRIRQLEREGVLRFIESDVLDYEPEEKHDIVVSTNVIEPMGVRQTVEGKLTDPDFPIKARQKIRQIIEKSIQLTKPGGVILHYTGLPSPLPQIEHPETETLHNGSGILILRKKPKTTEPKIPLPI